MSYEDDPVGYEQRLKAKLRPDVIRGTLAFAGLYQVTHEMIKHAVLIKVREFFCSDLNLDGSDSMTTEESERYRCGVLALAENRFRASLLWLVKNDAITQIQADRLELIRGHRDDLVHELIKYLIDPDEDPDERLRRKPLTGQTVATQPYDLSMTTTLALVPVLSVLAGAAITYWLNVRARNRTRIEDILHDAIGAVAIAAASREFIGQVGPWRGARNDEYDAFTSRMGKEGNERYIKAVADARSAIARASAYEPELRRFYAETAGSEFNDELADEIIAAIRRSLANRSRGLDPRCWTR